MKEKDAAKVRAIIDVFLDTDTAPVLAYMSIILTTVWAVVFLLISLGYAERTEVFWFLSVLLFAIIAKKYQIQLGSYFR